MLKARVWVEEGERCARLAQLCQQGYGGCTVWLFFQGRDPVPWFFLFVSFFLSFSLQVLRTSPTFFKL